MSDFSLSSIGDGVPDDADDSDADGQRIGTAVRVVGALLASLWAVEIADAIPFTPDLQANGIRPRETAGLDGILWAPFLHSDWWHLIANSAPFAILGGLVAVRGLRYWLTTTLVVAGLGGLLTWLLAGSGNHIGASGVVFGYFGALIGAAVFERRIAAGATAMVAIMLYGGLISGFLPRPGISWEGHLFGAIAGLVAARMLAEPRVDNRLPDPPLDDPYWEV